MNHILLVEDSAELSRCIRWLLAAEGFGITHTPTTTEARGHLLQCSFDLLLLDLMLPDGDGLDLCREVRPTQDVPIIVASARGNGADRMLALEAGADMYVPKPLDLSELLARIKTCLRLYGKPKEEEHLRVAGLSLDPTARRAYYHDEDLALTPKECDLLAELMRNCGAVCTSEHLLWQVWGYSPEVRTRTLDVHIGRLRQKLAAAAVTTCQVLTVPGVGYRFEDSIPPITARGSRRGKSRPVSSRSR